MKDVKIVIGANYGDEGKGLLTRHFSLEALKQHSKPVIVFHNGTAQRGHTVDYTPGFKHVYHHFGSGTREGVPTYFADTFLLHPMEYVRELKELLDQGIAPPTCYCDPNCLVITPFDMLADHITEEYIAVLNGGREYGSCGYGTWCAVEGRFPEGKSNFTITDFAQTENIPYLMEKIWYECLIVLVKRGVDLNAIPEKAWKQMFSEKAKQNAIKHFTEDIKIFLKTVRLMSFNTIWKTFDYHIFENGQGLGIDKDVDNDWHTTSKTGVFNPYNLIKDKTDFNAEICYVTRSYLTRHGVGPLEEEVKSTEINENLTDTTNIYNPFQEI